MWECMVIEMPPWVTLVTWTGYFGVYAPGVRKKFPTSLVVAVAVDPSALWSVTVAPTDGASEFPSAKTVPAMLNAGGSAPAPS
jgi:hypothetical protein